MDIDNKKKITLKTSLPLEAIAEFKKLYLLEKNILPTDEQAKIEAIKVYEVHKHTYKPIPKYEHK